MVGLMDYIFEIEKRELKVEEEPNQILVLRCN